MKKIRKYHVIIGSSVFFDNELPDFPNSSTAKSLNEMVRLYDLAQNLKLNFDAQTSKLVLRNNDYHSIADTAHDRIGPLIENLTTEDADIYIHNPTRTLFDYLKKMNERKLIKLNIKKEEYDIERTPSSFKAKMSEIATNIIGQETAINEITKSLWYLTSTKRTNPYVIMLYGNSSLGKTELVKEIANKFFKGKVLEKHLSMFKNDQYSHYFFGDAPNRKSIGYDLLERESNLIFFDELDKCPEYFYSAFYTLFDNPNFKDATYDVDISGTIIVLTSNYQNEEEMKKNLGLPIFYRIDKFIHFDDFSCDTIYSIVQNEINKREDEYQHILSKEKIYSVVSPLISACGENARTIKYKVQQVVEELLFHEMMSTDS